MAAHSTVNSPERFTRRDAALLLLLAGLIALFFWRILTPNPLDRAQFPPGDFTDQFYAFRVYTTRAFADGRIPLWSENFNSGHPFLADIQSQVFYPPALLNTVINLALFNSFSLFALELEALLHFYLASAFTYLFARRVLARAFGNTARVGAFVSALVFTFGGYLTSYPSLQLAILETAAWLPLALYFLDRATDDRRQTTDDGRQQTTTDGGRRATKWVILAGIVLGIAALAGHPQTFLFVVAVCVIYFVWRELENRDWRLETHKSQFVIQMAGQCALLLLIAFGIAAIDLIPALEYQQLSTREALAFADAAKGFPTLDILQFILPGYASAFASPLYIGVLPLWLAIFALVSQRFTNNKKQITNNEKRIPDIAFWGLLALGALILSFGFYVFAYVIFYLFVPGASLFRQQERLAFVVSFALAMLAGYGMMELLNAENFKRARKLYVLLPVGAAIMLALMLVFFIAGVENPQGRLAFLGDRAGLLFLQFALASLLLGLYLRKIISVKWFAPLALVLILFDLWSVGETTNKGRVEERFAEIPFAQMLQNDSENFRVAADEQILPGHFGIPTRLQEIGGISPLRLARYDELLKLPREIVLPLLNVKYVITRENITGAKIIAREGDTNLLQLQNTQPRAWLVGNAQVETNDANAAQLLANNFDIAHDAIVATQPPFALDANAANGSVNLSSHSAQRLTLVVNSSADGLLVVSENFYPGWQAAVDGVPTEILRANLTLRAVAVRAGQHRVEMWYDPFSFKLGAVISGVTLLLCVGALIFWRESGD